MQSAGQRLDYFVRRRRFSFRWRWNRKYNSTCAMGVTACLFLIAALILFKRSTFAEAPPPSQLCTLTTYAAPVKPGPVVPAGIGGMTCVSYGIVLIGACIGCGVKTVRLYFANTPHVATSADI